MTELLIPLILPVFIFVIKKIAKVGKTPVELKKVLFLFDELFALVLAHVHPFFTKFVAVVEQTVSPCPQMRGMTPQAAAYAAEKYPRQNEQSCRLQITNLKKKKKRRQKSVPQQHHHRAEYGAHYQHDTNTGKPEFDCVFHCYFSLD
jgi:hypothetical protein